MDKQKIVAILTRHPGSISDVAGRANVSPSSVSHWLTGRNVSANVAKRAEEVAMEILRLAPERAVKQAAEMEKKREIIAILGRHRGTKVEVARRAGVPPSTVSLWFRSATLAKKVGVFAEQVAAELRQMEKCA